METITNKPIQTISHTIPMDVFMDILRILLKYALVWQVEGINERENSLLIQISFQPVNSNHRNALENMRSILSDYGYYLKGSPNDDVENFQ